MTSLLSSLSPVLEEISAIMPEINGVPKDELVLEKKTTTNSPNSSGVPPLEPVSDKENTMPRGDSGTSAGDSFNEGEWLEYIDPKGLFKAKEKELLQLIQTCRPDHNAEPANIERSLQQLLLLSKTESQLQGSTIPSQNLNDNLSWDFSSATWPVEDRGRLYSSLIAIASNRHLQPSKGNTRSLSLSHLKNAKPPGNILRKTLQRSSVLVGDRSPTSRKVSVLVGDRSPTSRKVSVLWEIIEKDEDFMTLLLAQPSQFRNYPVPFFEGCDQDLVTKISDLWLSPSGDNEFGVVNFYKHVFFQPIVVEELRNEKLKRKELLEDGNITRARNILCCAILKHGAKEGARFLQMLLQFYRHDYCKLGDMVKEMFSRPCDYLFRDHFLKIKRVFWDELQGSKDISLETEKDGERYSTKIGLPSKHTDYNLLCWAARRGYADLIMLVELVYRPPKKCDKYYYVNYALEGSSAWKCALWCATRHGQKKVILELLKPDWIVENVDFNDYPWGWLPPLHLVALLGDVVLLGRLTRIIEGKSEFDTKESKSSGAHKKDYKERIPLDYAMAFSKRASQDMHKKGHKDVVKKLLLTYGVGDRLQELYQIYTDQASTVLIGAALIASVAYIGWLQPPLGYQDFHDPSLVPTSQADPYMAIEGHGILQVFIVFNGLSFFLALATMFMGVITTSFVHDNHERTRSLIDMRRSSKGMIYFFIGSMITIVGAFISAGAVVLPPIQKLKWSMIASLVIGGAICLIPLLWILWSIREYRSRFKLSVKKILTCLLPAKILTCLLPAKKSHSETVENGDPRQKNSLLEKFTEEECEEKFEKWDADRDGYITKTELLNLTWSRSPHVSLKQENMLQDEQADEIMNSVDGNADKKIDSEEFKKIFMKPSES